MPAPALRKQLSRLRIKRSFIVGVALVVGLVAGANAIANIAADRAPDVALDFWRTHPVALATKAEAQFGLDRPDEAKRLARQSIRSTALSSKGFQVLGMAEAAGPEGDTARPLLEYASRLSRRETPTQIWLLQQELFSGDVDSALRRLDGAMRVSEQSRSALFPLLGSAIATDGLLAPAMEIFAREPVWLLGFMRYAIRNRSVLPNLARIVVALPQDSVARSPEMQAALLRAMVVEGRYSEGREFLNAVAPTSDSWIRDPSFSRRGTYTPFDWDYTDEADLRAFPSGEPGGGLRYSAGTGQGGQVASQLIALKPGMHRLAVSGSTASSNADGGAMWRIRCASDAAPQLAQLQMPNNQEVTTESVAFAVPADGCAVQWIELIIQATFSPGGIQGEVEKVRVERVSTGRND